MIDSLAAHLAMRNRALSLVVSTTGSASLAATTTGFTRGTGSFLTDGFSVGMDVATSGFTNAANNGNGVVTAVTAGTLTVSMYVVTVTNGAQSVARPATVVEAEAAGRTIAARLPSLRAWENLTFIPASTIPYVEEEFVPATNRALSFPITTGTLEETGLYVLKWYGVSGLGGVGAIRKSVDALKALFAPGTSLTAGSNTLRVRSDTSVYGGQLIPMDNGWTCCVLTIPWRAWSQNVIAA